ncbi:MAG TPA: hypothetical protein VF245_09530 [Solirubrobacterales bacterium]
MSDLGKISAELTGALDRLGRVLDRFHALDRVSLEPIQAQAVKEPELRHVAALVARARTLVRQAGEAAVAARAAGEDWLSQHGSRDSGGSGSWQLAEGERRGDWDGPASGGFGSAAVETAWGKRIPTAGGMAYYPSDEGGLCEAAKSLPPFPGEYTLDAHGRSDCVVFDGRELGASEIAELIRADERWRGRPVRLFSCNTGRGENPVAGELAKLLGVRVTAPDDLVWSGADDWVGVAPIKETTVNGVVVAVPDRDREGSWRVFDPEPRTERGG